VSHFARVYFANFTGLLKAENEGSEAPYTFEFTRRNRRPPADPVNALLSFAYSLLEKDLKIICHSVGIDPFIGFFHQPRFGRPALALALMEEFVPLMFMDERPATELEMLVSETQRIGPNAGTCILLNQSLQDYRDVVGSHSLPTLLCWGRDEKLIPVAGGEWLAEHQPADLVRFERSGHCPMWEEPDRFHQVVGEFVSTLG